MNRLAAVVVLSLGVVSVSAQEQSGSAASSPAVAPETREMAPTVLSFYNLAKNLVTKAADKMPADAYAFQPTPEMRTFAAGIGHLVASNLNQCGTLLGRKHALAGQDFAKTLTTKEAAVKALADTFTFCDEYFTNLKTGAQLTDTYYTVTVTRAGQPTPVRVAHGASVTSFLAHNNEMYGYLAVYLRLKGIVPPSSER
jgi:hypothetical protein